MKQASKQKFDEKMRAETAGREGNKRSHENSRQSKLENIREKRGVKARKMARNKLNKKDLKLRLRRLNRISKAPQQISEAPQQPSSKQAGGCVEESCYRQTLDWLSIRKGQVANSLKRIRLFKRFIRKAGEHDTINLLFDEIYYMYIYG